MRCGLLCELHEAFPWAQLDRLKAEAEASAVSLGPNLPVYRPGPSGIRTTASAEKSNRASDARFDTVEMLSRHGLASSVAS